MAKYIKKRWPEGFLHLNIDSITTLTWKAFCVAVVIIRANVNYATEGTDGNRIKGVPKGICLEYGSEKLDQCTVT